MPDAAVSHTPKTQQHVPMAVPVAEPANAARATIVEGPPSRPAGSLQAGRGAYPMGRILGIPIYVHYLLPVMQIAYMVSFGIIGGWVGLLVGFLVSLSLMLTVLVHELGHALCAKCFGGECHKILLWPLGGLAYCGHHRGHWQQLLISLAGPATHIPQLVIWIFLQLCQTWPTPYLSIYRLRDSQNIWRNFTAETILMQISLCVFNMLPCYPLDGGQMLASFLLMRGFDANTAAKITCLIAAPIVIGLLAFSIVQWALVWPIAPAMTSLFVALWIASQISILWSLVRSGQASLHPLFEERLENATSASGALGGTQYGVTPDAVRTDVGRSRGDARQGDAPIMV